MHVILLQRAPSDLDAARRLLGEVFEGSIPVALAVPAHLLAELVSDLPSIGAREDIAWVRTGFTEPWFPMLPDREVQRQLTREAAALESAGLTPGPLWVTGPWDTHLPSAAAGVTSLLLPADVLHQPVFGVVSHLDTVLPVFPVLPLFRFRIETQGEAADAEVVVLELPPGANLAEEARRLREDSGCEFTTPHAYLSHHVPAVRHRPIAIDWEPDSESHPDLAVLHRKLVRLVTRVPERLGDVAELAVLEAERGEPFATGDVLEAHRSLIAARVAVDHERRRGDDWGKVTRLDWDADGRSETHIELPSMSIVSAPHRSGAVPLFDLKDPVWPVSSVPGEPGWEVCRWVTDLESGDSTPIELVEDRVTEARGGAVILEMRGDAGDGSLNLAIEANRRRVHLRYRLENTPPGWIGPELKLMFAQVARVRVDGSAWVDVTEPTALAGHKIRLTDGETQVLMSSLTPTECFVRPGIEGSGLVVWPHWASPGSGSYEVTVDLAV